LIRAVVKAPLEAAESLRAQFVELAPEGFEEVVDGDGIELAAYGEAGQRVVAAFPEARVEEVDEGWEDRWREFHRPVRIGPLWVGPPWLPPPADATAVVIDPARAFGTGAHPTTRLCLELLLEQQPGSVVDVGCGSGVLAIAAALLGHAPVHAVDNADAAVEATRLNAAVNGVTLEAEVLDATAASLPSTDLAFANIALAAVELLDSTLWSSRLIASGYLTTERPDLPGYRHVERRELDGWAADLFEQR
jgi:ribosomal protein L11 methyltransferase